MKFFLTLFFLIPYSLLAIDIQHFKFTPSLTFESLESAHNRNLFTNEQIKFLACAVYTQVDDPLVAQTKNETRRIFTIINHLRSIHGCLGAQVFTNHFVSLSTSYSDVNDVELDKNSYEFQDMWLKWKWTLFDHGTSALAIIPHMTIPIGSQEFYLSDGSIGYGLDIAYERLLYGKLAAVINAGYHHASNALTRGIDYRNKFQTGIGFNYPIMKDFRLGLEWKRDWSFPLSQDQNPNEVHIVGQYNLKPATLFASFGIGDISKMGSVNGTSYRAVMGVKVNFGANKKNPILSTAPIDEYIPPKTECLKNEPLAPIYFSFNSSQLSFTEKEKIKSHVKKLSSALTITIEGHTDKRGSRKYNQKLSRLRAIAVLRYIKKLHINPEQVYKIKGYGFDKLQIRKVHNIKQHRLNRRVELKNLEITNECME